MSNSSNLEKVAEGVLGSFLGGFLGAAVGTDVAAIVVNLISSGVEHLGVKAVQKLRSHGNFHLEKLVSAALKAAVINVLNKRNDWGGKVYWEERKRRTLINLSSKLQKQFERNPTRETDSLLASLIVGHKDNIKTSLKKVIDPILIGEIGDFRDEDKKKWESMCEETYESFFVKFKEFYASGDYPEGKRAVEREVSWATLQAVNDQNRAIAAMAATQLEKLEQARNELEAIKNGLSTVPDWIPEFAQISQRIDQATEVVVDHIDVRTEEQNRLISMLNSKIDFGNEISLENQRRILEINDSEAATLDHENKRLCVSFENGYPTVQDVMQGLCSFDETTRLAASHFAGELMYAPAIPFLIKNLDHFDRNLRKTSVIALGRLKAIEAAPKLFEMANDASDVQGLIFLVSTLTTFGPDIVDEENLPPWIRWLTGSNEHLIEYSYSMLSQLSETGRLDVASFADHLIPVIKTTKDEFHREYLLRMLVNIDGISQRVDAENIVLDANESALVKSPCIAMLRFDSHFEPILKNADRLLGEPGIELPSEYGDYKVPSQELIITMRNCRAIDSPEFKRICQSFDEIFGEREKRNTQAELVQSERIKTLPKAISLGGKLKKLNKLLNNEQLGNFMQKIFKMNDIAGGRRGLSVIQLNQASEFCSEDIEFYLTTQHFFKITDFTKLERQALKQNFSLLESNRMNAFIVGKEIPSFFYHFLYWFYEKGIINFSNSSGVKSEQTPYPNDGRIILIMDEDIRRSETWSEYKLTRMFNKVFKL